MASRECLDCGCDSPTQVHFAAIHCHFHVPALLKYCLGLHLICPTSVIYLGALTASVDFAVKPHVQHEVSEFRHDLSADDSCERHSLLIDLENHL